MTVHLFLLLIEKRVMCNTNHFLIFQIGVDFVTPLCSQVTYAGVLDDTFGIRSGI